MLVSRLSVWLCALLAVCAQVFSREQPLSVTQAPGTNSPAPGGVVLRWNPSPDTNATGYFLCWGLASEACTNRLDAGKATTVSVGHLQPDLTYYFTVVAYDAAGRESLPSNEITHRIPARASAAPTVRRLIKMARGRLMALVFVSE